MYTNKLTKNVVASYAVAERLALRVFVHLDTKLRLYDIFFKTTFNVHLLIRAIKYYLVYILLFDATPPRHKIRTYILFKVVLCSIDW